MAAAALRYLAATAAMDDSSGGRDGGRAAGEAHPNRPTSSYWLVVRGTAVVAATMAEAVTAVVAQLPPPLS